jgi:hypothetical protein
VQRILKEEGIRFVQAVGRGEESVAAPRPEPREMAAEEDEEFLPPEDRGPLIVASGSLLSDDTLRQLQAALDELIECERVLRSLKAPGEHSVGD